MKKDTYVGKVSPGRTAVRLSKAEVALAVFRFAYDKPPTVDELPRLTLHVNENPGVNDDWELVLGVEQKDPLCSRCKEKLGSPSTPSLKENER